MIKTILFDLDGVLVDIAPEIHYQALNAALQRLGHEPICEDAHARVYNGLPTKRKLEIMGIPEDEIEIINAIKQRITMELLVEKIWQDDHLTELIHCLNERGIKVGCVTNCSKVSAEFMLAQAGLAILMDCLITNEDVECPKPDPEGYLKAMLLLGAIPDEVAIFEDSEKGLKAATESGAVRVIKVENRTQFLEALATI